MLYWYFKMLLCHNKWFVGNENLLLGCVIMQCNYFNLI